MTATAVPPFALRWQRREPPLPAAAVTGTGPGVRELAVAARGLLLAGARLRAVADADTLVVLGASAELPWVDGARYLGWDDGILVPTTSRPWPAAALWRDALAPAEPDRPQLVVLLPDRALVAAMPSRNADPAALDLLAAPHPNVPGEHS